MAFEFKLPDIGEGLAEAEIVRWLVAVGDQVGQDEPLVEVETDKAVVDIPSPVAGTVLHHGAGEGETCDVGSVLAVIGEAGEAWPGGIAIPPVPAPAVAQPPLVGTLDEEATELVAAPQPASVGHRPQALPLVRRLAREHAVDLSLIEGSGPGGRIEREDVLAVVDGIASPPRQTSVTPPDNVEGDQRVRMTKLRRTIADRMLESWTTIPHVTTFDEVDATRLLDTRKALAGRHGVSLQLDALVIAAVAPVLGEFTEFNAVIDGDEIVYRASLNVGVAVDAPEGLMVPIIKGVEHRSVLEIASEITRLSDGAINRTLAPDDLRGGTFTVSNIGAAGGGYGTPIIPPGTSAILSVGRARTTPVVRDGAIVARPMMPIALSYDHRLIDGGLGRRFTARLIENLEEPALFLA